MEGKIISRNDDKSFYIFLLSQSFFRSYTTSLYEKIERKKYDRNSPNHTTFTSSKQYHYSK